MKRPNLIPLIALGAVILVPGLWGIKNVFLTDHRSRRCTVTVQSKAPWPVEITAKTQYYEMNALKPRNEPEYVAHTTVRPGEEISFEYYPYECEGSNPHIIFQSFSISGERKQLAEVTHDRTGMPPELLVVEQREMWFIRQSTVPFALPNHSLDRPAAR